MFEGRWRGFFGGKSTNRAATERVGTGESRVDFVATAGEWGETNRF